MDNLQPHEEKPRRRLNTHFSPGLQLLLFVMTALMMSGIFTMLLLKPMAWQFGIDDIEVWMTNLGNGEVPQDVEALKWITGLSLLFTFAFPPIVFATSFYQPKPFEFLQVRPLRSWKITIGFTLLLIAFFPLTQALYWFNAQLPLPLSLLEEEKKASFIVFALLSMETYGDLLLNVLIISLIPAIAEELTFRGALQPLLIQLFKRPWAGILLSAAVFSALHGQWVGFLPRFGLGILLSLAVLWSGSLWLSILLHFFYNAVQVVAAYFVKVSLNDLQTIDLPKWYVTLLSLTLSLLLGYVLYRWKSNYIGRN